MTVILAPCTGRYTTHYGRFLGENLCRRLSTRQGSRCDATLSEVQSKAIHNTTAFPKLRLLANLSESPLPLISHHQTPWTTALSTAPPSETRQSLLPLLPPHLRKASTSQRTHALELIESERAYASGLALIRDVHLPVALGTCFFFLFPSLLYFLSHTPSHLS